MASKLLRQKGREKGRGGGGGGKKEKEKEKWVEYRGPSVCNDREHESKLAVTKRLINDDKKQRTKAPRVNFSIFHLPLCIQSLSLPSIRSPRSPLKLYHFNPEQKVPPLHCDDKM